MKKNIKTNITEKTTTYINGNTGRRLTKEESERKFGKNKNVKSGDGERREETKTTKEGKGTTSKL